MFIRIKARPSGRNKLVKLQHLVLKQREQHHLVRKQVKFLHLIRK